MKIIIECGCGNKIELEGNHAHFSIYDNDFDCFMNDAETEVVIECDKCNKQEKINLYVSFCRWLNVN